MKTETEKKTIVKKFKIKKLYSPQTAITWAGHFAGHLSVDSKKVKGLEMFVRNDLPGWVVMKHNGDTAIAAMGILCEIDTSDE